jgi:hypothetical protein
MNNYENNLVARTLIITWGGLAKAAGEQLSLRLRERQGPATAVAVIHLPEAGANGAEFTTQLGTVLTQVSPPNLPGLLAQTGWRLRPEREIRLILVLDAVAEADRMAQWAGQSVVDAAYRQLGVECQVTLLWLAPEMEETVEACLQATASFSYTPYVMALSLTNETGLRLPVPEALSTIGAEVLWSLCTTPFYDFLKGVLTDVDQIYTGLPALVSLGISVWEWSPTAVFNVYSRRWQQTVLSHWLSRAETEPAPEAVAAWQQEQALDKGSLVAGLVAARDTLRPAYSALARHFPWPWHVPGQINQLKSLFQEDMAAMAAVGKQAAQDMAGKREQAAEQIALYLASVLDGQPIAGIDTAAQWVWSLADAFDAAYEQMLDEAAAYDGIDSDLAVERGQVEAQIRERLSNWPGAHWRYWLGVVWRFWRWPKLFWRYWQLRQLGLRLAGLLMQQSVRLREQAKHATAARLMAELARLARQEHSCVTEIGEMLASWQGEIRNEKEEGQDEMEMGVVLLPVPDELYDRLIIDAEQEAILAAEAIGGLGQQLRQLDDAIVIPLAKLAGERLAGLWTLTAVDILDALLSTTHDWQAWQQAAWQAATPLWRYDEGQLSETARRENWTGVCVIGAGVDRLAATMTEHASSALTEDGNSCHWLAAADHRRLIVIRLRRGLALSGIAAVSHDE